MWYIAGSSKTFLFPMIRVPDKYGCKSLFCNSASYQEWDTTSWKTKYSFMTSMDSAASEI